MYHDNILYELKWNKQTKKKHFKGFGVPSQIKYVLQAVI